MKTLHLLVLAAVLTAVASAPVSAQSREQRQMMADLRILQVQAQEMQNMSISSSTPASPRTRSIACPISSRASFTSSCHPIDTAVNCGRSPTIISAALTSSVASCPCVTTTTPIIAPLARG